ncbi:hypothetical protein DER45DRAFT_620120 [Fusarium avenaceum]|nr:hypothetical protein DER45DRAFT_620120 [Fusarium avenaceum]
MSEDQSFRASSANQPARNDSPAPPSVGAQSNISVHEQAPPPCPPLRQYVRSTLREYPEGLTEVAAQAPSPRSVITHIAVHNGVELPSLYQPGGSVETPLGKLVVTLISIALAACLLPSTFQINRLLSDQQRLEEERSFKRKADDLEPIPVGSSPTRAPWYSDSLKAKQQLDTGTSPNPTSSTPNSSTLESPSFPQAQECCVLCGIGTAALQNHWALVMIDLDTEVVFFYDPLPYGRHLRAEEVKRLCYWVDPQGEDSTLFYLCTQLRSLLLSAIKCLNDDLNFPTGFSQPPKDLLLSLLAAASDKEVQANPPTSLIVPVSQSLVSTGPASLCAQLRKLTTDIARQVSARPCCDMAALHTQLQEAQDSIRRNEEELAGMGA